MSPLLIAQIYALMLFFIGLSLLSAKKDWLAAVKELLNKRYGVLLYSFACLPFMIAVVLVHNIWAWTPTVIITAFGWLGMIKCVVYLINPHFPKNYLPGLLSIANSLLRYEGIVLTVLGAGMIYFTFVKIDPLYFGL